MKKNFFRVIMRQRNFQKLMRNHHWRSYFLETCFQKFDFTCKVLHCYLISRVYFYFLLLEGSKNCYAEAYSTTHSVRMRENTDQKNYEYRHVSRSAELFQISKLKRFAKIVNDYHFRKTLHLR